MAILRRTDIDGDARMNYREFIDALRPLENFMPLLEKTRMESGRNKFANIPSSPLN
jgi:hypothetical protein